MKIFFNEWTNKHSASYETNAFNYICGNNDHLRTTHLVIKILIYN